MEDERRDDEPQTDATEEKARESEERAGRRTTSGSRPKRPHRTGGSYPPKPA